MRTAMTLVAFGLSLASTAAAQGGEVIIRRPGEKDQVIRLDEKQMKEEAARMAVRLKELAGDMQKRGFATGFRLDTVVDGAHFNFVWDSAGLNRQWKELAAAGNLAFSKPGPLRDLMYRSIATRPRLGVYIYNRPRDSDKYGAYVAAVTPGGPADAAGILVGDVITRIDGKSMTVKSSVAVADPDASQPSLRLSEVVGALEVGKPVDIEFRRGNDTKTVKVSPFEDNSMVAMDMPRIFQGDSLTWFSSPAAPSRITLKADSMYAQRGGVAAGSMLRGVPQGAPMAAISPRGGYSSYTVSAFSGPLGNLQFAAINEKLGAYFGTNEGVLVLSTGEKGAFGLTPGDVVVSVDGRKATSPSQLVRLLLTYDKGDEYKLQIMRQKKSETLSGKLP